MPIDEDVLWLRHIVRHKQEDLWTADRDRLTRVLDKLEVYKAALEKFADIDVDFIATDEPFRHLILKARECLKS